MSARHPAAKPAGVVGNRRDCSKHPYIVGIRGKEKWQSGKCRWRQEGLLQGAAASSVETAALEVCRAETECA